MVSLAVIRGACFWGIVLEGSELFLFHLEDDLSTAIPEALVRLVAEPILVVQCRFFCVVWELFCWKVPSVRSKLMLILVGCYWFHRQIQD